MQSKLELNAHVNDAGEIIIHNRRLMQDWAGQFKGKNLKIVIQKAGSKRSLQQNKYYWAVVIEEVRHGLLNIGYQMTPEEVHYWLKFKFNPVYIPGEGGEAIPVPGTTTTLTKTDFSEYVEKIIHFASEYLSIAIPAPNENLEMKFE